MSSSASFIDHFSEVTEPRRGEPVYPLRRFETEEKAHGREDLRNYLICPVPENLPDAARWKHLKAIGIATNNTVRDGTMCIAIRYYIFSRYVSGRRFADAVRVLRQLNLEFVADRVILRTKGGSKDDPIPTTIRGGRESGCGATALGGQSASFRSLR